MQSEKNDNLDLVGLALSKILLNIYHMAVVKK